MTRVSDPYGGASGDQNPYGQPPAGSPPPQNPYGQTPPPPPNPYGGSGGGYGGGFGGPPPFPGGSGEMSPKTDGVSIASLVTALLCITAPIGFILGIVGLRRTKGGKRKGKGFAIAGLVVGLLGTIAIGLFAGLVIFAVKASITPGEAKAGQCFESTENDNTYVLLEKDCTESHDGEIYGAVEVTDDNVEQIKSQLQQFCSGLVSPEDLQKLTDYSPALSFEAISENPDDISVGDHLVCFVTSDKKLTKPIL